MAERLDILVTDNGSAGRVEKNISSIGREAASAGYSVRSLDHLLSVLGAGLVISKFVQFADEWQNIHNKLLNVTSSSQNLIAVNDALFAGAQKSRTAYAEFVNVYQELAIQATRFGTSQQQMVDITTTMMQAAQLAHPSMAAMKAGVEQLVLTMERGRMTTRAFSALLKDTPQLAQALADGLGISINKLRELAHHSQITAAQIVEGLENAGPKVAEKFLKLTPTIENAMIVLHNGWVKFIGDLDSSTGILTGITGLIIGMSHHMDVLAMAVVAFGSVAVLVFSSLARKAIAAMWASLVAAGPVAWAIAAIMMIAGAIAIFGDKVAVTSDGFVSLLDVVKGTFATIGHYAADLFGWLEPTLLTLWDPMAKGAVDSAAVTGLTLQAMLSGVKGFVNGVIGLIRFMFDASIIIWHSLHTQAEDSQSALYQTLHMFNNKWTNEIVGSLSFLGDAWQKYAAIAIEAQNKAAPPGTPKIAAPTAQPTLSSQLADVAKRDFNTDYVGNLGHQIMASARGFARVRHAGGNGTISPVGGDPEDDPIDAKKHHPDRTKSRSELIAEEMKKFGDQTADATNLDNTFLNRKAFEEVTKFNDDLQKHKDKKGNFFPAMTADEKAALYTTVMGLESATRLQKERDAVMEAAIGPRLKYEEQEIAIGQLLQHHNITAQEAARADRDAAIAFLSTQEDVASGLKLGALNILKEMQNRAPEIASAMKGIWDAQEGPLLQYQTQLIAVNELLGQQLITAKEAARASRDATISYLDSQTDAAAGVTRALLKIEKTAQDVATQMEQAITDAFNGIEDAFVKASTGQKVDAKGAIQTVREDLARMAFAPIKSELAGFLQSRFGVTIPGLAGKVGESRANPMWVRSADALPGQDVITGGRGALGGLLGGLFGVDVGETPVGGNTQPWDESFKGFTGDLRTTMHEGSSFMSKGILEALAAGMSMAGGLLGGGGKKQSIWGALLEIGLTVGSAYLGHIAAGGGGGGGSGGGSGSGGSSSKGYATGGGFTVGGGGGVDSQLVQFKATPGERVQVDNGPASGGGGVNYYDVHVDARGASDETIESRIHKAMAEAFPAAEKRTREAALGDVGRQLRRQSLAGAR